ncbi:MAG TPA: MFS transporter [Ottowia sp.]|uniref:MFS transporter n=1 Tax=Ottowia sp. TaxID=1898956 RepID=UPI002C6570F7|nr:MFS transporter [Ottowia sp.]HMN21960.1 MFS transporter [Ottowia sp.]
MPSPRSDPAADDGALTEAVRWRVLAVLLATIFMSLINVSVVNVALPSIQDSLQASQSDLQWVLSGYALTFGVVLVAAGRAGDIMGRGGWFVAGVLLFTAASVAAGLAPDARTLNVARFLQGLGSGLITPQGVGMIQQYFRDEARARAFGYFGSMVGVSVAIGPVLGGVLIMLGGADLGWRLAFLVNVPTGLLVVALALRWFPRPLFTHRGPGRVGRSTPRLLRALDPVGSLLLGLAVFAVLYPFMEYRGSHATWLLLPVGLALAWLWVAWERHHARAGGSPMVDLRIFRTRSFSNGTLIMALYFLGMTSIWVIVALYFQQGAGKSAFEAGLVGIPASILSALSAHWAGQRVMRLGRKVVIGGLLLGIAGLALCVGVAWLHGLGRLSIWWLVLALVPVGIAQGAIISPNQTLTLAEVPLAYAGSSGAVMQTGQRIGTSVGIALITSVLFAALAVSSWPTAVMLAFTLIAGVFALALWVAWRDLRERARRGTPAA